MNKKENVDILIFTLYNATENDSFVFIFIFLVFHQKEVLPWQERSWRIF